MPLWGLDRWVSLGDLFVDVNILELTNSNRRSELDDLWQDFTKNNSNYRSLDRIGLSNQQQRVSGLAVLEKDTNLMVVGKPGSGKTTYLQRIVTECNEGKIKSNLVPVLIKLREYVDDGRKYAYKLEQFLKHQWRLNNRDIELILNKGLALILLDGLDEVVGEAGKQITQEIKRFARSYPQVQIIVTCRTQSQESKFDRFDSVEVADFNEEQVKAFTEHWFGTVCTDAEEGKTKAKEFLSQLFQEENKPIRELAITPILLSLTCAVFQQTGKFYSKRSKLYEEGLELLLEQWDKSREVERDEIYRDLSVERKLELLSYVAVKKFEQEQYVLFEQEELEEYIGEFLGIERRKSRSVLKAIASQHGLLIERAREILTFSHLTFQEYLVTKWFVDNSQLQNLVNFITTKSYREVFLLVIEIMNHAEELLQQMKIKIDTLLASDKKLQEFLDRNTQRSSLVDIGYKPASIRAFSFKCNRCSGLELGSDLAFAIDMSLKNQSSDNNFPGRNADIHIQFPSPPNSELYVDEQLDANISKFFDSYPNTLVARYFLGGINSKDEEFNAAFKDVSSKLPARDNWDKDGILWVKQLQSLSIKYRMIGKNWQFSENQKELLTQYYDANKLLVDCLNSSSSINDEVREEIEETLLLPIAEIEKRKQSNS